MGRWWSRAQPGDPECGSGKSVVPRLQRRPGSRASSRHGTSRRRTAYALSRGGSIAGSRDHYLGVWRAIWAAHEYHSAVSGQCLIGVNYFFGSTTWSTPYPVYEVSTSGTVTNLISGAAAPALGNDHIWGAFWMIFYSTTL